MRKKEELADPNSCLNRAGEDEFLFVLRGKDVAAPDTVRAWCRSRIEAGKNGPKDRQILEALNWAETVEREQLSRPVAKVEFVMPVEDADDARQKAAALMGMIEAGGRVLLTISHEEARQMAVSLLEQAAKCDREHATKAAGAHSTGAPVTPKEAKDVMEGTSHLGEFVEPFKFARQLRGSGVRTSTRGMGCIEPCNPRRGAANRAGAGEGHGRACEAAIEPAYPPEAGAVGWGQSDEREAAPVDIGSEIKGK